VTGRPKRSKTRIESAEELRRIAAETREAAEVLDRLFLELNALSEPVWRTGWSEPIASVGGFGVSLRRWANVVDELADQPFPDI
jgi:hypothetical protein